jgi:hypothetical protein
LVVAAVVVAVVLVVVLVEPVLSSLNGLKT